MTNVFTRCCYRIIRSLLTKSLASAIPCSIAAFFCHDNLHEHFDNWGAAEAGTTIYSGFMFALGFLIVFRMNQAYSRWWEAGTLLQQARAQWFNAYSSLVALSDARKPEALRFHHLLARLMSLLYGTSILELSTVDQPSIPTVHIEGLDEAHVKFLEECHDKTEVVLQWIQRAVVEGHNSGVIEAAPPIISRIYSQLGNGMVNVTTARKMVEFPIPGPILHMIPFMLCVQWLVTVLLCTMLVESSIWAASLSFINTFCFWSINYLARELEMPYGDDPDDLPLQHLAADMNASLTGLLHPLAVRAPSFTIPISEDGKIYLRTGVMELRHNGLMEFKPSSKPDSDVSETVVSTASATSVSSQIPRIVSSVSALGGALESFAAAAQVKYEDFHVPRIIIGKRRKYKRGPTQEASARRVQQTEDHARYTHTLATAARNEAQSGLAVSKPEQTAMTSELSTVQALEESDIEESETLKPSLECSASSGHNENTDNSLQHGKDSAQASVLTLENTYAI